MQYDDYFNLNLRFFVIYYLMLKISKHFKGVTRKQMNPFGGGHGLK
jgi:hypothetical protein